MLFNNGDMVRGFGRLMKIFDISSDVAHCVWFDSRGQVHKRDFTFGELEPFWMASTAKSLWPETTVVAESAPEDELAARRKRSYSSGLKQPKKTTKAFKLFKTDRLMA
jgi:hypothetical protein